LWDNEVLLAIFGEKGFFLTSYWTRNNEVSLFGQRCPQPGNGLRIFFGQFTVRAKVSRISTATRKENLDEMALFCLPMPRAFVL
jgi:hypothetical protein